MSHLLQTPWTFYFYQKPQRRKGSNADYESCIHKIAKVSTVEEFWGVYSRMIPINRNGQNAFHFFRGDARAMWEDADNINGGAFNILIPTGHGPTMWEKLLLDLIGENLDYDIIGATISAKPNCFSLFIWNRTADLETARKLSDEIFKTLELPFQSTLRYSPHSRFLSSPGQEINTTTFKNGPDGSVMILEKKDPK